MLNAQKAAHFEATAADLEREKQLQGSIQQTYTALEAVKEQRDAMVQVLQAAAGTEQPAQGQQQQVSWERDWRWLPSAAWRCNAKPADAVCAAS